jgi:hypothetical protein
LDIIHLMARLIISIRAGRANYDGIIDRLEVQNSQRKWRRGAKKISQGTPQPKNQTLDQYAFRGPQPTYQRRQVHATGESSIPSHSVLSARRTGPTKSRRERERIGWSDGRRRMGWLGYCLATVRKTIRGTSVTCRAAMFNRAWLCLAIRIAGSLGGGTKPTRRLAYKKVDRFHDRKRFP